MKFDVSSLNQVNSQVLPGCNATQSAPAPVSTMHGCSQHPSLLTGQLPTCSTLASVTIPLPHPYQFSYKFECWVSMFFPLHIFQRSGMAQQAIEAKWLPRVKYKYNIIIPSNLRHLELICAMH